MVFGRNLLKFRKIVVLIISCLLMIFSYQYIEFVILSVSNGLSLNNFKSDQIIFRDIEVSKIDNPIEFKNDLIELAKENSINIYFHDYEVEKEKKINVYLYTNNQDILNSLPIIPSIKLADFSKMKYKISNNSSKTYYKLDVIPSKTLSHEFTNLNNYEPKNFLGELTIFGPSNQVFKVENELLKKSQNNISFRDNIMYSMDTSYTYSEVLPYFFIELLKSVEFQILLLILMIVFAVNIYLQERKIGILRLQGYSILDTFLYFFKDIVIYYIIGAIFSIIPIIYIYQGIITKKSFAFLPTLLVLTLIIFIILSLLNVLIIISLNKTRIVDTIYRKKEKNPIIFGPSLAKILGLIVFSISSFNLILSIDSYKDYSKRLEKMEAFYENLYIIKNVNTAQNLQLHEAILKDFDKLSWFRRYRQFFCNGFSRK